MKRTGIAAVAIALLSGALTSGASAAQDYEASENVRLLRTVLTGSVAVEPVFQDDLLVLPTLDPDGFWIYRILPGAPYLKRVSRFICPGADHVAATVWGDYVFQSVSRAPSAGFEEPNAQCNSTDASVGKIGIRIVDISDPRRPHQVGFVETACGSSGHALVPHKKSLYLYVTKVDFAEPGCSDDLPTPTFQMEVVKIDLEDPARSAVVSTPAIGQLGGCHEIWVFVPRDVAVCTALGDNSTLQIELLDTSDPANPSSLAVIREPPHIGMDGASFSWNGRYLAMSLVTDPSCAVQVEADPGAVKIYDIKDLSDPVEAGKYSIARSNIDHLGVCWPSDLSFIPIRDERRMIAPIAWNGSGLTFVDFSDPANPREVGFYYGNDEAFINAVWHNGRIYTTYVTELGLPAGVGQQTGFAGPGLLVLELEGTDRLTTSWFRGPHNPRTQMPSSLR